jgi:alanine dehydrogenase
VRTVGIGKEIKTDERRVALLPEHARDLIGDGCPVLVEQDAGEGAGFKNEEYVKEGARIVSKEELYKSCDLIIKVKCPVETEYNYLRNGQVLLAYLHFDENIPSENVKKIASTGVAAIAYEWVEEGGDLPLLRPMSELSGNLFALRSLELLTKGKGQLPGESSSPLERPNAMVIGIGRIGANVLKVFLANNMNIFIVDKHPETIENRALRYIDKSVWSTNKDRLTIIKFNNENPVVTVEEIGALMDKIDILINCAVRRPDLPKFKMEYLITREMVSKMRRGSVVCDATACDKDLVETAISSEKVLETYEVNGVVHYNCDHIPSLVPDTASTTLANATFPYVRMLAREGFVSAVSHNQALFKAVMCHQGYITHKYTCQKKNLPYKDLRTLLKAKETENN